MIKLSVSEKGFALIRDGKVLVAKAFTGSSKRDVLLKNLQRGVVASKDLVRHEDLFVIETNDSYVYKWLKDNSPNSKYMEQFSITHKALNKLICKYRFVLTSKPAIDGVELERPIVPISNFEM